MRIFIIGLSILFFALSGIITFKASGIPARNTSYQTNLKELKSNNLSSESADILGQVAKEQAANQALIKELQAKITMLEKKLSVKAKEIKSNTESESKEHNMSGDLNAQLNNNLTKEVFLYSRPDDKNKLKQRLNADPQFASRKIYTIQTGSFTEIKDAMQELNSILHTLNKKMLNLLRIEKIGKFYTVRFGRFDNYKNAEKNLKAIKPQLSAAIILQAYIKDGRIIRLYSNERETL